MKIFSPRPFDTWIIFILNTMIFLVFIVFFFLLIILLCIMAAECVNRIDLSDNTKTSGFFYRSFY